MAGSVKSRFPSARYQEILQIAQAACRVSKEETVSWQLVLVHLLAVAGSTILNIQ
jgi:hypothetical protein